MRVFVNGEEMEMLPRLYFAQVVRAAFGCVYIDDGAYTVTFVGDKAGRGTLKPREWIGTEDGMRFVVQETARP